MVYRQDNRRNKHKGRYTALGIILGISLTLAAIYFYDNNRQPILDNVNEVKQFAIKQIPKDSPVISVVNDNPVVKPVIPSQPVDNSQQVTQPVSQPKVQITPTSIASALHILVNLQRANNGLPNLQWDDSLAQIALSHSNDMQKNNYFTHNDLQGQDPSYRLNCNNPRENIAWTDGYSLDKVSGIIIDDWMGSQLHRENILNSISTNEGIGVSITGSHVIVTEDFC